MANKRLFVEKPRNDNGYRQYSAAIVEGLVQGNEIVVTAPETFIREASVVDLEGFQELSSEAGPARIPQISEHKGDCNAWRDSIINQYALGK